MRDTSAGRGLSSLAAVGSQSRLESARYAALPADLLGTIPRRVLIARDDWTGRRAHRALRQRRTVCVTTEDITDATDGWRGWTPPRSLSPDLCCQSAAVRTKIQDWNRLAETSGTARPPTPPSHRLRKRHTITGARPGRPGRPRAAMGGSGGGGGGGGAGGPAVLVQTWETRRNSGGGSRRAAVTPPPPPPARDSDDERCSDWSGAGSDHSLGPAQVEVQSVATQTHYVSKVVRRVPVASNEVYMVQVSETPPSPPAGIEAAQIAVAFSLPPQKHAAGRTGQPPKPPRMLNIESGLDFSRDPPSFSSLASAASSEGSQGGGGGGSSGGGGRLHEAINHDLVLVHEAAQRAARQLRSGSVGTEAETVLRELDLTLESAAAGTGAGIGSEAGPAAGAGAGTGPAVAGAQHSFSSEFAAQMARETGTVRAVESQDAAGGVQTTAAASQRSEARSPESGTRSLDSEALSIDSYPRSPEIPPCSPTHPREGSSLSVQSPSRPAHRSPARPPRSPSRPSVSPDDSQIIHPVAARQDHHNAHIPHHRTHHTAAARRASNTENFNLVEEITDGARSVLPRPDDYESLSSGGYDMGDVGVTRLPTPSTPRTTPAASPAPRLESPLYATPEKATARRPQHAVVVAIDFGTTYSGYAFSFVSNPDGIHVMRKAGGGDPGLNNQKTPTALLLTPEAGFSAFGFAARDAYHDLEPRQTAEWLYFDKFKLALHTDASLNLDTYIPAANGQCISALLVFAHALSFFRRQALDELDDLLGHEVPAGQIRWVITVPAIWRQHAKQFMRQAAYKAGLCTEGRREDLLIALEPEVASVYCHSLRLHELVHEGCDRVSVFVPSRGEEARTGAAVEMVRGTRYLVVDCGGGTVDITVHEVLDSEHRRLKEVYKASGGPYGSVGVDMQFESLLCDIFGAEFVSGFRSRRPAAWIDLMVAFEARKRAVSPDKASPFNVALPFAFISEFKKVRGKKVEQAVKSYKRGQVRYTDGMLRLDSEIMQLLFRPTLDKITEQVESLFDMVSNMQYLFLVGGFSESKLLQERMKRAFSDRIKVVIPQEVSLAILRGAVLFGLDPGVIQVRRSTMTYGVGVLNKFMRGIHPQGKLLVRDGREWCADIFDKFVTADQSVGVGETLLRRYTPARADQTTIVLHLYCSHKEKVTFVTDSGVERCGTLKLLLDGSPPSPAKRREIQVRMRFGDTEILASAVDLVSQRSVTAEIDFLGL